VTIQSIIAPVVTSGRSAPSVRKYLKRFWSYGHYSIKSRLSAVRKGRTNFPLRTLMTPITQMKGKFTMRKIINVVTFWAIVALGTTMLQAQASRTWVSGVGDDANPCSRTAPCKTFAGAISKTAPGGEIDALDPGGFGALTITKAITIDGGGGQVASVLVNGTNGIVVAAQPGDVVILRNLRINGIRNGANGGLNGIRFISGGDLNVENCFIFDFTNNGIDIALGASGQAHIINTVLKNNGNDGIRATTTAGIVTVGINNVSALIDINGIEAADKSRVVINNSFIENGSSNGVIANGDAQATIDNSDVSFNGTAIQTGAGATAILVANSKIAFNGAAFAGAGNLSYGTNRIHGNGSVGPFSLASPGQQ
jgi:hypothetical protein